MTLYLFAILLLASPIYGQSDLNQEKAGICRQIIEKLTYNKIGVKVLSAIDLKYRSGNIASGAGGTIINFSTDYSQDTLAFGYLKKMFSKRIKENEIVLKSFAELHFTNRNNVITSEFFLEDTSSLDKGKVYIEINTPIDGWEPLQFFINDKSFLKDSIFMRYYFPRVCIPVFVYDIEGEKESSCLYLFRFEMKYIDGKLSVKLLDYRSI